MSHFFPAYIGKPPPHVLRKRKLQEQEEREREEKEREERDRELSPAVPDPEPSTPARFTVFGTPTRSVSRIRKTYAHKRGRSFATPRREALSDEEERSQPSSREPSSSRSPTKGVQKQRAEGVDPARPAKRPRWNEYNDDDMYADPPTFEAHDAIALATSRSRSPVRRRKSSVYVEIQTPLRRSRSQAQRDPPARSPEASMPPPSTRRPRGRPPKFKPIAIPTPSTTSEESAAQNAKRRHSTSGAEMTLSEALNQSFAQSIASSPAPSPSRARKPQDEDLDIAGPSHTRPMSVKRGRGRPSGSVRGHGRGRGRGRGRGAASSVPFDSRDFDHASPPASAHGSEASLPTWTALPIKGPGATSSHRPQHPFAREEEESADDELASVTQAPVKRTPGRPRRPAAAGPSTETADNTPTVKRRGRPPGSKNAATIAREAAAAAVAHRRASFPGTLPASSTSIMANYAAAAGPPPATPVKRGRGRPRKSAPEPSVFGLGTIDYMEPLKDPDEDKTPFRRRTRSQSRQGRGSTRRTPAPSPAPTPRRRSASATRTPRGRTTTRKPPAEVSTSGPPKSRGPPSHYLDIKTMQWRPRARSTSSSSPPRRRVRPVREMPKATEFQTRTQLCNALKRTLLEAPAPKLRDLAAEKEKEQRRQEKEKERRKHKRDADRLRLAPSGVLFFGEGDKSEAEPEDEDEDEQVEEERGDATVVFCGSWSVLADLAATFDDSLAMKTLHEVVMGVRARIELDKAAFAKSDDGQTISVTVPCACMSVRGQDAGSPAGESATSSSSSLSSLSLSSQQSQEAAEQCAGEMAVSVTQELIPEGFSGVAKAMRMTVLISHY